MDPVLRPYVAGRSTYVTILSFGPSHAWPQVLSTTGALISSNEEQLRARVSSLQKLEGAVGGWQTCKIICGLMVCVGIFTFTFLFMRLVGKRG